MASKTSSPTINKFTVSGVILIMIGITFAVLGFSIGDISVVTMTALPVTLLGAAMFLRNKLDQRKESV